jgi:hypothetical protein
MYVNLLVLSERHPEQEVVPVVTFESRANCVTWKGADIFNSFRKPRFTGESLQTLRHFASKLKF